MTIKLTRTKLALAVAALGIAVTGVSYAAIPAANSTISACKDSKGALKVIDTEAGQTCSSSQQLLNWNQQGPAGPQGAPGISGYEVVRTYGFPASLAASSVRVEAPCSAGKKAIGGGGYVVASEAKVASTGSYPSYVPNSTTGLWRFYAQEMVPNTNEYWHAEAWVICAYVD